uniref:Binding-protein-dependent transport systems inner membrane component n=1 Tax=Rhodopseudomonas palustris (strain BisA53) TaxID=316055 RepID=Q07J84_RHOP5
MSISGFVSDRRARRTVTLPIAPRLNSRVSIGSVALVIAVLTALAVAAPVISIAVTALQPAPDVWPHLIAYVLPQALADTTLLLLGVGTLALLIGAGTAWLISSYDFPGRAWLVWLMPLPLAIPTYISAYVYVDLFEPLGLVHRSLAMLMPLQEAVQLLPNLRSLPGAVVVIGLVLYPYVYLSARTMFQSQSADLAEAARVLGAGRWTIARRVLLPTARPALAVGVALVSLETLNDIGASEYLGVRTLTVAIFNTWLNRGSLAGAAQLALVALGLVALLIAIERFGRRKVSVEFSSENPRLRLRKPLAGAAGWLAATACGLPALLGFGLPAAYLIGESLRRSAFAQIDPSLWRDAWHSVSLAATATALALALGLIVILARRWRAGPLAASAASAAQMGYALPGLVLALGLLAPLLAIDGALNALAASLGVVSPGLLLIGSGGAVVAAYVIRFLAVPTGLLDAGFARIPRDYDDCARAAGASRLTELARIDLPLLRPAMIGAAIVVFVDCLKELPATLLLRPLNVETLSTSIYQYASRGSFEEGAPAALLIVAASILPVIWLTRFADAQQGPA